MTAMLHEPGDRGIQWGLDALHNNLRKLSRIKITLASNEGV